MFFVVSGALLLICSTFMLYLWSRSSGLASTGDDASWRVLIAKRDEIERDPTLPAELKDELRIEWAHAADIVLSRSHQNNDKDDDRDSGAFLTRRHGWLMSATVIAVALFIYGLAGRWDSAGLALQWKLHAEPQSDFTPPSPEGAAHPGGSDNIDQRIAKLESRLEHAPNDIDGWVLLSRSYGTQRNFAKASDALEHALALSPGHPDLLADLADMLAMKADKSLSGRASALIDQALQADPAHRKALSLAATRAMQQQHPAEAVAYWRRLRATFPADAPDVAQIDAILADLGTSAPATNERATSANTISGQVTLAPALLDRLQKQALPDTAVLYVLARAAGSPMPVAVMRVPARQLLDSRVVVFKLDDSLAPMPTQKLSAQAQVDVEARISMRGGASREAGDLSATMANVKPGAADVRLQIGTVSP